MIWLYIYLGLFSVSFCATIFAEAKSKREITVDDIILSILCSLFLLGVLLMISDFICYIDKKNYKIGRKVIWRAKDKDKETNS